MPKLPAISAFLFLAVWFYGHLSNYILAVPTEMRRAAQAGMEVRGWGFGIPEPLAVVLAGIIIIVISWIMDVGRELREDQDLTV